MKIIGAIMIIISTTSLGVNEFLRVKKRIKTLEEMLTFTDRITTEIRYLALPVDEMMETMRERNELPQIISEYGDVISFEKYGLNKTDSKQLGSFLAHLGRSDIEGQLANCRHYKTQLEYELEKLRRDFEKKGKMYLILGLSAGLIAVLLFS